MKGTERQRARRAFRCALTRLALGFDRHAVYTGDQVQEILIGAMLSIDDMSDYSDSRRELSRTNERRAVHRNLAAYLSERESGLGVERCVDPFSQREGEAGTAARSEREGMEDL